MPKTEYQRISGNNNIKWECMRTDCSPHNNAVVQDSGLLSSLVAQISALTNSVVELSAKIDKLADLPRKIDDLDSKLTSFETKLSNFEERLVAIEQLPPPANITPEELISEMNDRSQRAFNLMLFNLPESNNAPISVKKANDRKHISELFNHLCPNLVSDDFIFYRVVGKSIPNKIRPIKIVLKSVSEVNELMG
ncbi:hypothetical protein J6590_096116, partial [Homalodisca vitripennis]